MPRERMVAQVNETYVATLELDARSHQWMADIEGLPVHTWGRSLAKVKQYAIEALALHLDVPKAEVSGRLVFEALDQAETARADADGAAARAAEAKAAAARALVRDAHLSMRDAAEVLGLSHQRVQQLLAS